jgi:hypothetical protein
MASAASHRQMVVPEISATKPQWSTSARISGTCSLDRGRPRRCGNSQAMALISTTTSGGENRRSTMPGALLKPGDSFFEEPFAPLRHDFSAGVQARRDLIIAESLSREQDDLGSYYISVR